MTLSIGGVSIGEGQPCRFVAEISNNHNGSLAQAMRLIEAAKVAGADFVKFQCYTPSEVVALRGDGPAPEPWGAQGWTMRALYEKAATPLSWFPYLASNAASWDLPWFSSVFGAESLALLESLGNPCYKLAKLDSGARWLRKEVRSTGKPVIISTDSLDAAHHVDLVDEREALDPWEPRPPRYEFLYCPGSYPAQPNDFDLSRLDGHIGGTRFLGVSSHCLDPLLPVAAVARGAKLLEYHFQLDDEPSELEANVSLTASAFAKMVSDVRKVEEMLA